MQDKSQPGQYERRVLQLRFHHTTVAAGKPTGEQLAEVDINIADYVADNGSAQVNVIVACNEAISSVVGSSSKVLLTIGCAVLVPCSIGLTLGCCAPKPLTLSGSLM